MKVSLHMICLAVAVAFIAGSCQSGSGPAASDAADMAGYTPQQVREMLMQDRTRAAGFHHSYEIPEISDTKAPKGYKPFYISHYGRHGCRYQSASVYDRAIEPLSRMKELGALTPEGESLLADISRIKAENLGMDWMLTRKGGATHRGISSRMLDRYPGVFSQKGRDSVVAVSSTAQRCVMSMSNFVTPINERHPELEVLMDTGDRYMDYIAHDPDSNVELDRRCGALRDSIFIAEFDRSRAMGALFTDTTQLAKFIDCDPDLFFYTVMDRADLAQCMDSPLPDIFGYFTPDEVYAFFKAYNARAYGQMGITPEFGDWRPVNVGGPLLRDFLEKADAAVAGNGVCADLRFGHDSIIAPFMFLLGIGGADSHSVLEASSYWLCFKEICMGANIQFVYYGNRGGGVLVKILVNEQEAVIPGLEAVNGVYYDWTVLRAYLASKTGPGSEA